GTRFFNNIFYVDGRATYDWGKSRDTVFENNIFCGTHADPPPDPRGAMRCPPLNKPGGGDDGFDSLDAYRFREGSEAPRGRVVENNGGRDFFGTAVAADKSPAIGAAEPAGGTGSPSR